MASSFEYFAYLQRRSLLGKIYRKYWLYPSLSKYLAGKVLDIGCGIGDMLSYIPNSVGVDINEYNVEFCKRKGLTAYHMPFDQIPLGPKLFDSVLLDNVLEHLTEPRPLLAEINRVLNPGGSLIIGVPGVRGYSVDRDHKVFYDEQDLENLAEDTGYFVKRFMYMPLFRSNFLSKNIKQYCIYSEWMVKHL